MECNKCEVKLELGKNITPSRIKGKWYICSPCLKVKDKKKYINNKDRILKTISKYRTSIPAGVYCIKYKGEIVYIGESKTPIVRRDYHFGAKTNENISLVAQIIKGNKKNYTFELLKEEKDKNKRVKLESYYIEKYKPKYNNYKI
jgi:hypothetical protein